MALKYTSFIIDPQTKQYVKVNSSSPGSGASYDDLADQPVVNAKGSSPYAYVNVAGLDYGHYMVSGYYKWETEDDVQTTGAEYIDMLITTDTENGKKVALFNTVEGEEVFVNLVYYNGSLIEKTIKKKFGGNYWGSF